MAKKQKQPTKTCADCVHESACRVWTDGRFISDAVASKCQNHETVKGSAAYLCGMLDERKRKRTNADRIRAMNNYELAVFLAKTKAMVYRADLPVIAYSTQDMADNLEWLQQTAEET